MNGEMRAVPMHELLAELMRREHFAGRIVLDQEVFIGGLRRDPGAYQLTYLGPVKPGTTETIF